MSIDVNKVLFKKSILVKIVGIFVLITLVGVVSEYVSRYATGRYALYATRDMKEKLAWHITRVTIGSIHESKMGDLAARLNSNADKIYVNRTRK